MFYIYAYLDPRKKYDKIHKGFYFQYEPFYIGKGKKRRMFVHLDKTVLADESHKSNKINKIIREGYEPLIVQVATNIKSEKEAYKIETSFIREIGRFDLNKGPLVNLTDGIGSLCGNQSHKFVKIYQFTKDGDFIKMWNSLEEALESLSTKSKGNLVSAAKGFRNYVAGYRWSYTEFPNELIQNKIGRKKGTKDSKKRKKKIHSYKVFIYEYFKDNELIIKGTLNEISQYLNISKSLVSHCANKRRNTYDIRKINSEQRKIKYEK